jgi:ribose transport system permease protein
MSTHAGAPRTPVTVRLPEGIRDRLQDVVSQLAAAGGLIIVFVALSIASPYFLTSNNLFNIGVQVSVVAIIAVGQTLVILTAGIDLSVGSVAGLGGILGSMAIAKAGFPIVPGLIIGVLAGAAVGLVNGLLVTQLRLPPFIATLGMLGVARGLTFIVGGENAVYGLPSGFRTVGEGQIGPIPLPLVYLAVIAGAGYVILSRTKLGRYAYAIGSNKEAARLSGISINRYLISVYVICAGLAGFGGMIAASLVQSGQPNYGVGLELNVIAACVIGGTSLFGGVGTIGGTLIGAFLMAVITNGAVLLNITQYYQQVIIGVIIWSAVWWDQVRRRRLAAATAQDGRRGGDAEGERRDGDGQDQRRDADARDEGSDGGAEERGSAHAT